MKKLLSNQYVKYVIYTALIISVLKAFKIDVNLELLKNVVIGLGVFSLVLSPLIIIHEFAHFIVGKKLGAEPEVFSIGMGKKIFGFKWLGADFILSLLPIGGYVRFKKVQFDGENGDGTPNETIAPWRWFFIALAGPASNFILAFLVFWGLLFYGLGYVKIGNLESGTKLVYVAQSKDQVPDFLRQIARAKETDTVFEFKNKIVKSEVSELEALAITKSLTVYDRVSLATSLSSDLFVYFTTASINSIVGLVTNIQKNYKTMSSPIGITQQVQLSMELGWLYVGLIFGSLSFGLGFMNMLPLSVLDGGRCVMAIFQSVIPKRIPVAVLNVVNLASFGLVLSLMLIGLFSDLVRNSGFNKSPQVNEEAK